MAHQPKGKIVTIPKMETSEAFKSGNFPSAPTVRKSWPDQKYIVKLPTAEEMEALRKRRAAAGGPGAQPWTHPAEKAKQNKVAKKVPDTVVKLSAEDSNKLKQAKVETNASGSTVKMPTAEAIAMLQKRRAAAAAANKAAAPQGAAPAAAGGSKVVDVCAAARERTLKAKAAANLNRAAPPTKQGQTKVDGQDLLTSFLRPGVAAAAGMAATSAPILSEEEKTKRALEAEKIKKARAEAAQRDRENGNLRTSGATVKVPSAEAIEMLRLRREKASAAAKAHERPAANAPAAKKPKK